MYNIIIIHEQSILSIIALLFIIALKIKSDFEMLVKIEGEWHAIARDR